MVGSVESACFEGGLDEWVVLSFFVGADDLADARLFLDRFVVGLVEFSLRRLLVSNKLLTS